MHVTCRVITCINLCACYMQVSTCMQYACFMYHAWIWDVFHAWSMHVTYMQQSSIKLCFLKARVDKREEERECRTPYYRVQTPFEEYRGQLVQYCTQNALIYPQTSGLVTTTTPTSCSSALQGWYCGHTPGCSYHNSSANACRHGQFDLCTLQRVFADSNTEYDTLFPPSYILLLKVLKLGISHRYASMRGQLSL